MESWSSFEKLVQSCPVLPVHSLLPTPRYATAHSQCYHSAPQPIAQCLTQAKLLACPAPPPPHYHSPDCLPAACPLPAQHCLPSTACPVVPAHSTACLHCLPSSTSPQHSQAQYCHCSQLPSTACSSTTTAQSCLVLLAYCPAPAQATLPPPVVLVQGDAQRQHTKSVLLPGEPSTQLGCKET